METYHQNVVDLLGKSIADVYLPRFKCIQKIPGSGSVFKRINSATKAEQLKDYLAEVNYNSSYLTVYEK